MHLPPETMAGVQGPCVKSNERDRDTPASICVWHLPGTQLLLSYAKACFLGCATFQHGSALISMSTIISSIGQYCNLMYPHLTTSWMKWYHMSMCLIRT